MSYAKKLNEMRKRLADTESFTMDDLGKAFTGIEDFSVGESLTQMAKSKATNVVDWVFGTGKYDNRVTANPLNLMNSDYDIVRNGLEETLNGRIKYPIRETSYVKGGNLGSHDSSGIEILNAKSIPKNVFGNAYKWALDRIGRPADEFNNDVKDYIALHEILERNYMLAKGIQSLDEVEHAKFESNYLKSLEDLSYHGYDTGRILEAAVASHSVRDKNDTFLQKTRKYMNSLAGWIDDFKNYRPAAREYAYV